MQLVTTLVDYQPDIVILYDGRNDLGLPMTYESRPNFPYNFQAMEEAWDLYRREHSEPLWRIALGRSFLYRGWRARLDPRGAKLTPAAGAPFAGSNVVPASRILADHTFVVEHVAAYLSNWRKLIELARTYDYQPVCILDPVNQLDPDHSANGLMKSFHLDRETALQWIRAFNVLYDEAGREIESAGPRYPQAVLLNMARLLPTTDFWDLAHVYDEVNATRSVNQGLKDLFHLSTQLKLQVAAVLELIRRILVTKPATVLLLRIESKTQAGGINPALADWLP